MNTSTYSDDQGSMLAKANAAKYAGKYLEAAEWYRKAADAERMYPRTYGRAMLEAAEECEAKARG